MYRFLPNKRPTLFFMIANYKELKEIQVSKKMNEKKNSQTWLTLDSSFKSAPGAY